ncbi:MAG: ribonuclease P protein component [candidate division KSB1 bacterium]|nr:ribonuclease P protein component [candidate division KSB1 bacterium]MDZ7340958.1 ribonuclease P protein component [candidate division KSB1 bacterium]
MVNSKRTCRLSKDEILRTKDNFDSIFKHGKVIPGTHVIIVCMPAATKKVGFVVAKKIKKNVAKNRLKRLLREIYRLNKDKFPEKHYLVLIAKGTSDNFFTLQQDVMRLLNHI